MASLHVCLCEHTRISTMSLEDKNIGEPLVCMLSVGLIMWYISTVSS